MSGPSESGPGASEPSGAARRSRALVLGGGGLTGLAWLHGVLTELPDVVGTADRVIGTSAGALLAARLLSGGDADELTPLVAELSGVRIGAAAGAALLAAQLWPSRRHALQWLGRRATRERSRTRSNGRRGRLTEDAFVDLVGRAIGTTTWPAPLIVVAVDAVSGRPAYFTPRSEVDLARAVAASCAMPGVFPAVHIEDRAYLDGGLRSPANADLAADCDPVLILAPQSRSVRQVRRPTHHAARLAANGAAVVLLQDERPTLDALSPAALDAAREQGRRQGRNAAAEVRELWRSSGSDR